jgi:hypothetical protein
VTVYRPADLSPGSDERRFVISSWSSSYKASHFAGLITAEDWAEVMHVQLGKILDRPTTRTLVAVSADRRPFLYGFIAGDTSGRLPLVHFAYVKDGFRSKRVGGRREGPRYARGLFAALGVDPEGLFLYTCRTPVVSQLSHPTSGEASKIPRATFCPAAGRYNNYQESQHEQR